LVNIFFIFPFPPKTSNQINELEYVYSNFKKEAYEIIESAFQEIDEYDFEEYWDKNICFLYKFN